jgi:hypothetical protein
MTLAPASAPWSVLVTKTDTSDEMHAFKPLKYERQVAKACVDDGDVKPRNVPLLGQCHKAVQ